MPGRNDRVGRLLVGSVEYFCPVCHDYWRVDSDNVWQEEQGQQLCCPEHDSSESTAYSRDGPEDLREEHDQCF